jgi:hypothetical protein
MRVVENTTIFFNGKTNQQLVNILDTCSNKSDRWLLAKHRLFSSPLGKNGTAVTIPLFFLVCFDNNIGGPFIRIVTRIGFIFVISRTFEENIVYQNPEQSAI